MTHSLHLPGQGYSGKLLHAALNTRHDATTVNTDSVDTVTTGPQVTDDATAMTVDTESASTKTVPSSGCLIHSLLWDLPANQLSGVQIVCGTVSLCAIVIDPSVTLPRSNGGRCK